MLLNQQHSSPLKAQFIESFFKDVNLGVILIDTDFKMVDISEMACTILGLEREKALHQSLDEIFSDVPVEHQLFRRDILDGMLVRNKTVTWTNHQKRYELLMDSYLLKDAEDNLLGAYVIFKDVTNLRSLEEQIQRSDRLAMIGQIAAGTAHEIRNPLTSIKGFLQVLRRSFQEHGMEKEESYTEIMLNEINRINALVNEFLLLSKPKHARFESIDVAHVLREILPIIHNEALLHDIHVQYQASLSLPKVTADRELLKQVFLNLSKNGIEAMSSNGTLLITERVDEVEKKVYVDIQDSGPGIPAYLLDKIFDPFFTTKENGTGLGLSVCQKIIHDLGGTIRVSSKGYGTMFTVGIPFYSR